MSNRTFYASTYVVADGVTRTWPFSFAGVNTGQESGTAPYLYPEDVKVQEMYTDTDGNKQTVQRTGVLTAPNQITIDGPAVIAGREIRIYRETELRFPLVDYRDLQSVSEHDLDLANRQAVFLAQETRDTASANLVYDAQGHFNAGDRRIVNLAPGIDGKDAVNMDQYNRTLRVPEVAGLLPLPLAVSRANRLLSFDSNGDPLLVFPAGGTAVELEQRLRDPQHEPLLGYNANTPGSEDWFIEEKLRAESVSLLDCIPKGRRAAVLNGTSTWDASDAINKFLAGRKGRITLPAGSRFAIAKPIKLPRGVWLAGNGTFDTTIGVGCKIYLLDGSNCEMLTTPAVDDGGATHFMALTDIVFDCNKAGQTIEVQGGVVKFWGAWVGSWIRRVLVLNSYGTAIDFRKGSDLEVSHLWVIGCATANGYAVDTNAELTGSALSGLIQFDNLYVENTSTDKNFSAKENEAYRGKNIRLRRLVRVSISEIHTEGAAVAIDLDTNHTVRIGSITGYNIGSTNEPESALVRHVGGLSRAVSIGTMFYSAVVNRAFMVRKAAALQSNNSVPEIGFQTNPYVAGYTCMSDNLFPYMRQSRTAFTNMMTVERISGYSEVSVNVTWGGADDPAAKRSRFKESGAGPMISTNIRRDDDKVFIHCYSTNTPGDEIKLFAPIFVEQRDSAANVLSGRWYNAINMPGVGTGPVYQRTTGLAEGVNAICTVLRGNGPPTMGADHIGQLYVDRAAVPRKAYIATNILGTAADWTPITGGTP